MSTLKVNAITETDGSAFPFGKILQYKIVKKTDGASTSSTATAGVEVSSDLRISLTPQNANNIIYCQANLTISTITNSTANFKIYRNTATDFSGTSTLIMPPDTNSANVDGNMNAYGSSGFIGTLPVTAFETASNTTARTYSPFWATQGNTVYINQWSTNYYTTSTFIVMEISQ